MAGQRSNKRNHSSRNAKVRRRRLVGLSTSASAFLALGLTPLNAAPSAQADELDLILDPILNSLASVDPTLGTELSAVLSSIDPTLFSDHAASATASLDFTQLLNQFIYFPIHDAEQDWITSPFGQQVDSFINTAFGQNIIGNGAPGTEADPTGGAGGLLFGDGGPGWNSTEAGVAGGDGGAAGSFGNGGDGGDGGAGAVGGDGGTGGSFMGIGGTGGDGGDGGGPDALPALGGAGGNAGPLGEHGAVGHPGTLTSGPPNAGTDGLSTTGTWLTDSDGKVVILHGLNEVNILTSQTLPDTGFGDDDAAFLAANGFTAVRVGVDWSSLEPDPGVFDPTYLASIEQTVQTLANHGIVSLLDFHQQLGPSWAFDGGGLPSANLPFPLSVFFDPAQNHAVDNFWANGDAPDGVGLENHYAQMMEYVANAFNGNPNVLGIEIMNEPLVGNQFLPTAFGSSYFDAQQLTPFYDQAASAIRAVNPDTPIFYEPNILATAEVPIRLGDVDASNTVLSFHDYCYVNIGALGCLPDVNAIVENAETYAQAHNIPAFMSEFGSTTNQSSLTGTMQPADQNLIGWTEWAYGGQQQVGGGVDGTPAWLVTDLNQAPVGDNVNAANLQTLAEPYPQVVAGTPGSFSFENGNFQFSYSTAHVDGSGDFGAGSQTTISVPKVEFPNGYQVSVTGGHVVSAPDASELVIASDGSASTVSVTVSPVVGG